MNMDEHLQKHPNLCRRVFQRMLADGSWSWKDASEDSTETLDMVESEDIHKDV